MRNLFKKYWLGGYCVLLFCVIAGSSAVSAENILLFEEFNNLDRWEPFYFPKIKQHSTYSIVEGELLKTESQASASAIIYREEFSVYEYPLLEWRWKVDNVCAKGDAKSKKGDDYPIRVFVVFKYDPKKACFKDKLKYKAAKILYGKYPPHSTLNYIWANKEHSEDILTNSYTDKAKMFLLQKGRKNVGTWQVERINILEDYRKAFCDDPPEIASVVIMNDSDNTKEQSTSYIDYLKIFQSGP